MTNAIRAGAMGPVMGLVLGPVLGLVLAPVLGLSALSATAALTPALAETLTLSAPLGAVAGTNSTATGTLDATYDTGTKKLAWKGAYAGIGTYATGGAIYGAGNAVEVRLKYFDSPFQGEAILTDKQEADLTAGKWLIIIRTAAFPNGEIGGRIARP
jgi:hypothetical protein